MTPMLVQYLVALCCLRRNPDAVDVTVGDLVLDVAADKPRDVDITVTLAEEDGTVRAFKAYEVKREGEPLDVATVEQLCMKLRDMPAITHRAVVSASGFTSGAIQKATAHHIELYELRPWTEALPEQFPLFGDKGRPDAFIGRFDSNLLCWIGAKLWIHAPDGPQNFNCNDSTLLFAADGTAHKKFRSFGEFKVSLFYRSTGILWSLEPAETIRRTFPQQPMANNDEFVVTPAWPHTHTLETIEDELFLKLEGRLVRMRSVTISGYLQWQKRKRLPEFHILKQVPTGEPFAGAAVADWGSGDGRMFVMTFSPESLTTGVHPCVQLLEKHKNAIRKLKIPIPPAQPE